MKKDILSQIYKAVKEAEISIFNDLVLGFVNPWCEFKIGNYGLMNVKVENYTIKIEIGGKDIERHPNLEEYAINSMKTFEELENMAIEELGGYDYLMKECYNEW